MKIYKSENKNIQYFLYRLVKPIFDPVKFYQGITGYFWYLKDVIKYNSLSAKKISFDTNLFPILDEKVSFTPFDAHYFYQQLWVFENVLKRKPKGHVDIGSTYEMSGYLSKIVKTKFIDYRPINASLKNLEIERGDILNLDAENNSIQSLSCLHTAEHIGLGRYGDPIDPLGTKKACKELSRVLAKNGMLYFSLPIGKERICFNAHRVHSPLTIVKYFDNLKLVSFSVIDDEGNFYENVDYKPYAKANYSCGLFLFTKK